MGRIPTQEGNRTMKKITAIILSALLFVTGLAGCAEQDKPSAKNPVTLTMWHVYGSQTKSPMNDAVDEFNKTVGREHGITINVVSVTSSSAIDQALAASANGEPGAENMPDLFTAYPRVVEIVGEENLLAWSDYFSEEELSAFTASFLAEGYFDESLLMLPIAKSCEALYLNKTLFDRFAAENPVSLDQLRSFAGVFEVARAYYDWSGGQNFMQLNDFYNYALTGMKAYDAEFIRNGQLNLDHHAFEAIWTPLAGAAIYGGICLEDGYAASRWKTVEIIANTGSSADVLYQPDEVVYADNTTETITTLVLPYPTFTDEVSGVAYRGGGLFAMKSEDARLNAAAYIFAKWLTEKEQNLNFVTQSGYLPVTDAAFDSLFSDIGIVKNERYHSLYQAVDTMRKDYTFYAQPLYKGASDIQLGFETNVKEVLLSAHNQYGLRVAAGEDPDAVLEELVRSSLDELRKLSGL